MRGAFLTTVPLLLFLVACDVERAAPPYGSVQSPTFANNPDNGNPRILRFGELVGFVTIDSDTNWFALHAGRNGQFGCNVPPDVFAIEDVQWIVHNADDPMAGQINEVRLGRDIYIAVFEGWDAWNAGGRDCADLFARKLAEGAGNLTNTDNDLFTYLFDDPRANHNAFGFAAQGQLTLTNGETRSYSGLARCVWDGDDDATLRCIQKINL